MKCTRCSGVAYCEKLCWYHYSKRLLRRKINWEYIDPYILPMVAAMRDVGFKTTYSCQGLGKGHEITIDRPYVTFAPPNYNGIRRLRKQIDGTPWQLSTSMDVGRELRLSGMHSKYIKSWLVQGRRLDKWVLEIPDRSLTDDERVLEIAHMTVWFVREAYS